MNMDIPTQVPTILYLMVGGISVITVILMAVLTIKIYKDEARNEDKGRKNTGW